MTTIIRILLIPIFSAIFSFLILSSESLAQKAKRFPIDLENSEVSFVGDDSFIKGRYTWEPLPQGHIWKETLLVKGGFMNFYELDPGLQYTDSTDIPDSLSKLFNRQKTVQKYGISTTKEDVKEAGNQYSNYYYLIKSSEKGTCANVRQYFGDTSFGFAGNRGSKSVFIGICWKISRGKAQELEAFVHKLMNNARFDEGAINKVKAASRSRSKPASQGSEFKNQLAKGSWEGVSNALKAIVSIGQGRQKGKLIIKISADIETCSGFWVLTRGSYDGDVKPEGTWSVTCTDNISAGGVFKSSKPGFGTGTGSDNIGRKIIFSYGDS